MSSKCREIAPAPQESINTLLDGRLRLIQSKDGYRFSVDALLLADFVSLKPNDVVVDLGTGCGVIPVILLGTRRLKHVFGLEIQDELVRQAAVNAGLNGFADRMAVVRGDLRALPLAPKIADVVICNPPYRKLRSGRINPDARKAIARHEIMASLDDILAAARYLLRPRGRLALVYPSVRLVDLLVRLRRFGLEPKHIQFHHPSMGSGAKLCLIEACTGGRPGVHVSPPVLDQGAFSIKAPS